MSMERRGGDRNARQSARRFFLAQPVFAGVMPRSPALARFLEQVELRRVGKGERVYTAGARSERIYLVRDGGRETDKAASYTALPGWEEETPTGLLIINDAHPFDDRAL